jgi:hypothetical protein
MPPMLNGEDTSVLDELLIAPIAVVAVATALA